MSREFETVKPGDIIVCHDEYSHDYEEHDFLVESVEDETEEGVIAYGKDLDYPEDESDDYIGRVSKANFVRFSDAKRCKHCLKRLVEGENHSEDSYEPDLCDTCMDLFYGYCDDCGKLFQYYDEMVEHNKSGVLCKDCRKKWIEETGYDVFDDIKFEERSYCPETGEYTYYFIAPAEEVLEMFPGKYDPKEVIHAEISIEIPEENEGDDLDGVLVSISPTRRVGNETEDYDWTDIELPDSQVIKLLERGRAKCPAPEQNPKQTAFKVHISEVLGRDVIIYAEDRYEAEEKAEELCNAGIIDLSGGDFGSRTVETIGTADIGDKNKLEAYGKEDE